MKRLANIILITGGILTASYVAFEMIKSKKISEKTDPNSIYNTAVEMVKNNGRNVYTPDGEAKFLLFKKDEDYYSLMCYDDEKGKDLSLTATKDTVKGPFEAFYDLGADGMDEYAVWIVAPDGTFKPTYTIKKGNDETAFKKVESRYDSLAANIPGWYEESKKTEGE